MINWLKFFVELCLLKAAPQDAPSSRSALYVTVVSYFAIGTLITLHTQTLLAATITALIETGLMIFLTNLILWARKTPERFTQSITSLMGAGTLIGLIAIPVLNLVTGVGSEEAIASVLWITLIVWQTLVIGHILRHTMDIPLIAGIGVALIYMYMSFAITLRILKVLAVPLGG
ncbi:MAG: hypothetical protein R3240_08175 [Gammaproteobacteria bacterium]|nr:hypothetical protein [Gammaproteobacteria bacterium]